eukprot:NODE_21557_length_747_cov_3.490323.p1 GENE.NODE_21557_length_747_cov_3.490323~~NODE_21557_length_747_cov_3.490323.p1  ORF type:complete len:143 (+),score=43.97 NODE_21557_length_747_cov_3.490323:248-676(+)
MQEFGVKELACEGLRQQLYAMDLSPTQLKQQCAVNTTLRDDRIQQLDGAKLACDGAKRELDKVSVISAGGSPTCSTTSRLSDHAGLSVISVHRYVEQAASEQQLLIASEREQAASEQRQPMASEHFQAASERQLPRALELDQ